MGRLLAPRGDSSSGGNSSSKGGSSGSASKGGATKRENGKEWIQSSSGMWVEKNSDAGKRVRNKRGVVFRVPPVLNFRLWLWKRYDQFKQRLESGDIVTEGAGIISAPPPA